MRRGLLALVIAACLAASVSCGPTAMSPAQSAPSASFDPAEYAPYAEEGTASISGQSFLRTRGGDVKYGAGERVTIEPATTYSRDWVAKVGGRRPPHPAVDAFRRETIADAEGRFSFSGLPAGEWIVLSRVTWEIPSTRYSTTTTGGAVGAVVEVFDGEEKSVVLQYMGR